MKMMFYLRYIGSKEVLGNTRCNGVLQATDTCTRLALPIIDTNLKIFYEKCWLEKLQAEFAVRGEAHGPWR